MFIFEIIQRKGYSFRIEIITIISGMMIIGRIRISRRRFIKGEGVWIRLEYISGWFDLRKEGLEITQIYY